MKRYLIFMFDNYYPCGGANDFIGSVETKEEIKPKVIEHYKQAIYGNRENLNIIDIKLDKIYGIAEDEYKDYFLMNENFDIDEEKLDKIIENIKG